MIIEEGKYYRRRDGSVVGPIKPEKGEVYKFKALGLSYTLNGRHLSYSLSFYDLIEEVLVFGIPEKGSCIITFEFSPEPPVERIKIESRIPVEEVLVSPVPPVVTSEPKFVTGLMDADGNMVPQIVNVIESIQIKEGEYYLRRDKKRIGPMIRRRSFIKPKYSPANHLIDLYDENGFYCGDHNSAEGHPLDIIRQGPTEKDEEILVPHLEVIEGRYYRRRDGVVTGPMIDLPDYGIYKFRPYTYRHKNYYYTLNGLCDVGSETQGPCAYDLVEEVLKPEKS